MILHITFHEFQKTLNICLKRTFKFLVYTINEVFSDVLIGEKVKAAALSVKARVLLTPGDVFQSHIPDL
jgi:hypothetical protein